MKRFLAALILCPMVSYAVWYDTELNRPVTRLPGSIIYNGVSIPQPSEQLCRDAGRIVDIVADDPCATNEAGTSSYVLTNGVAVETITCSPAPDPADQYPEPDMIVPMVDSNGVQVGTARLLVDSDTLLPVAVINSQSPQRPWSEQRDQFKARREEVDINKRLASTNDLDAIRANLRLIKDAISTNKSDVQAIANLTNGFSAAENRTAVNALRRDLIDLHTIVQDLRKAHSNTLREVD
jgi:hypothetical protein